MKRTRIGWLLALAIAACDGTSGGESGPEGFGAARLAVTNVPADALCLKVVATGSRAVTRDFALSPGANTTFEMDTLPLGVVVFNASAFETPCEQVVVGQVPRWIAAPVAASIDTETVASVDMLLVRNGRANVNVGFETTDAAPSDAAPSDAAVADAASPVDAAAPVDSAAPDTAPVDTALPVDTASPVDAATPDAAPPPPTTLSVKLSVLEDDVEEHGAGTIDTTSSDLELGQDTDLNRIPQIVGLRFRAVDVPPGATILNAYIQFTAKVQTDNNRNQSAQASTRFRIRAEKGNAPVFTTGSKNLSNRPLTTASVVWQNVPLWSTADEVSANTRSPSLVNLVQEVVGDPCWPRGGALAFRIDQDQTGSIRSAHSANASGNRGPTLVIEYRPGTPGACGSSPPPPAAAGAFLVPSGTGVGSVTFQKLLDVGQAAPVGSSYRLAGVPDGLGAFDNGNGTFTLLVNHELGNTNGIARAHGATGAFVSRWVVDKTTRQVLSGSDLIQQVVTWNRATDTFNGAAKMQGMGRFCSGDLPDLSAVYNASTARGYNGRIFFNGEETGADGRALAHVVDGPEAGTTYELPKHGRASWENVVLNPATGDTTVSVGLDDSSPGQLFVYKGTKTTSGNAIARAGLMNGTLYGVRVVKNGTATAAADKYLAEEATGVTGIGGTLGTSASFELFALPDTSLIDADAGGTVGQKIENTCNSNVVMKFQRPEDGAWDPNNPNDFYFTTTTTGRLWRLRFTNRSQPELGGTVSIVINTATGMRSPDNLAVTPRGEIIIQEDPGNNAHVARIWRHLLSTGTTQEIGQHDPARFGASATLTQDEESSGVVYLGSILGAGWFALDVQAHTQNGLPSGLGGELVENGQLLLMHVP